MSQLTRVKNKLTRLSFAQAGDPFYLSKRERQRLQNLPSRTYTRSPLLTHQIELTDPFWYLHCHQEIFRDQINKFRAVRADPLIIDCGANIGMSVIFFKYLYPEAKIIAFEPDPEIFSVLARNVQVFELQNVVLYQNAVWNTNTTLAFKPDGSVGGHLVTGKENAERSIQVPTIRLKEFLNTDVDFLKLDIEGAEDVVLNDCSDVLRSVRCLFVEYHGESSTRQTLQDLLWILQDAGFRYHIKEANPIQHPFLREERGPVYDLQLNIFGFRNFD